jgi:N6-adenosine-specific RNA methylase IME4
MTELPVLLSGLRLALQKSEDIGEVKDLRDKAEALRRYAAQAGHGLEMQNQAAEVKLWAERRAGELIAATDLDRGGRPSENRSHDVTGLSDLGIHKMQSHRWQTISSIPEAEFVAHIEKTKASRKELTQGGLIRLALHNGHYRGSSQKTVKPFPPGRFDVLYADPPWRFDDRMPSRAPERHYPTVTTDELRVFEDNTGRKVTDLAHTGSVLFLWAVNSMLPEALDVLSAWGFAYKTMMVWVKPKIGLGWYVRGQHETLLIGTGSDSRPPMEGNRVSSVIQAPAGAHALHSAKPEGIHELIDRMYPGTKKVELFARQTPSGWACWGNEVGLEG